MADERSLNGYVLIITPPIFKSPEIYRYEGTFGELLEFVFEVCIEEESPYIIFFEKSDAAFLEIYSLIEDTDKSLLDERAIYELAIDILKSKNVDYIGFDMFAIPGYAVKIWRIDISKQRYQKVSDLLSKECTSYRSKVLKLFEISAESNRASAPLISITYDVDTRTFTITLRSVLVKFAKIKASEIARVKTLEEFVILLCKTLKKLQSS